MCIHKYTKYAKCWRGSFLLFCCWEKKINAATRKKRNGIARLYVTFHTKSSHSNATAAVSPLNYHFSLYFSQHSQPLSMVCFYLSSSEHLILTFFLGFHPPHSVCDVILFYIFLSRSLLCAISVYQNKYSSRRELENLLSSS